MTAKSDPHVSSGVEHIKQPASAPQQLVSSLHRVKLLSITLTSHLRDVCVLVHTGHNNECGTKKYPSYSDALKA